MPFPDQIRLFDGAMGTELLRRGLDPKKDLNTERPEAVVDVHRDYIASGCHAITTNTFLANRIYCQMAKLERNIYQSNLAAARLARQAAADTRVKVFGDMGPMGQFLEPYGTISEKEAYASYKEQAEALVAGGIDGFIVETMMDVKEASCAVKACKDTADLPVVMTLVLKPGDGGAKTMMGNPVTQVLKAAVELEVDAIGANCLAPGELVQVVAEMRAQTNLPLLIQPNAGQPRLVDGEATYEMSAEEFASGVRQLIDQGATIVGGCCGTTPAHIREVVKIL